MRNIRDARERKGEAVDLIRPLELPDLLIYGCRAGWIWATAGGVLFYRCVSSDLEQRDRYERPEVAGCNEIFTAKWRMCKRGQSESLMGFGQCDSPEAITSTPSWILGDAGWLLSGAGHDGAFAFLRKARPVLRRE